MHSHDLGWRRGKIIRVVVAFLSSVAMTVTIVAFNLESLVALETVGDLVSLFPAEVTFHVF